MRSIVIGALFEASPTPGSRACGSTFVASVVEATAEWANTAIEVIAGASHFFVERVVSR